MLLNIRCKCQHCGNKTSILLIDGKPNDRCSSCGQASFDVGIVKGLVYIVSNPHQDGIKIGFTTKSLSQRLRSLSGSTGVPGKFEAIAMFPSKNPKIDEERVHKKLRKFRISKEHFGLTAVDAVLGAYRALNRRPPVFYKSSVQAEFEGKIAKARTEMGYCLSGRAVRQKPAEPELPSHERVIAHLV